MKIGIDSSQKLAEKGRWRIVQRLFSLPTFEISAHFFSGQEGEKIMKFYSRLENQMFRSQNFHIFWPFAHFLPTFKIKSGHDFQTKYNANTLIF